MSDLEGVRKFEFRPCRMKAGFDVTFLAEGGTVHGLCRDVSNAGIRAEFDGPVVAGGTGTLILRHPSGVRNLEAQVAYVEKSQVGLVFLFRTPTECASVTQLIAAIANDDVIPWSK
jgi:hypothetical protein